MDLAIEIKSNLQRSLKKKVVLENTGNIGKSYRKHDEIGTPYCITVDYESIDNKTVTIRNRDTMNQEVIKIEELIEKLKF